ncbi:hypothetical protein MRX96_008633 [Rhipicephalus microplus]
MNVDISTSSLDEGEPTQEDVPQDMGNVCINGKARVSPAEHWQRAAEAKDTQRPPGWDAPDPLPDRMTNEVSI